MKREEVAHHQRTRLYGAMIEAVARRGYAATTVAEVIALAGVSRRAFYEMFSNKEACFLATHDIVVARARKLMLAAWTGERSPERRLHAGCAALLEDIARSPTPAKLVLVESLCAGARARERMQLADRTFERMVSSAFASGPAGRGLPRLTSRAIVAGVRNLLCTRLRERREGELETLTDEVLDWCGSYHPHLLAGLPVGARDGMSVAPAPAEFLLVGDERSRALSSIVHLTLDEGYAELSDPQIAQFAGISSEAFHGLFANKEEAFIAVLDETVQEALRSVRGRVLGASSWPEGVLLAIDAFVHYAASHEALMRMAFVEACEAGPGVVGRMTPPLEKLARSLIETAPEPLRAPLIVPEAVAGALLGTISSWVLAGRLAELPHLVDHLSFLVLAPYIGAEPAADVIKASSRRSSGG
jgi:AcrR family transcriptional regulator